MPRPRIDRLASRSFPGGLVLSLVFVGGVLLTCCGGAAGVIVVLLRLSDNDVVEEPANDPPLPAQPAAPPAPLAPTKPAEPVFRKTWGVAFGNRVPGGLLAVSDDGRHVFAQDGRGVHVFDARTAEPRALLAGTGVPTGPPELWPVGADKVLLAGPPHPYPSLWHVTGTRPGEILPQPLMPPATPDAPTRWAVSPDGRYLFVGSAAKKGLPGGGTSLFKVFEVSSAQTVAQGWWQGGNARFTADGGRLLVAEANGRCRWLKVPGGVQEAGWTYPPAGVPTPLVSMAADGGLVLYAGAPAGLAPGRYLLDGRTGQVLRLVHPDPRGGPATVTADGRRLVGVVAGELLVTDARTGTELLRERFDGVVPAGAGVRADGWAVVVHDATRGELAYYEPRVPLPEFPSPTPPAPLSPVPDPLPVVVIGPTPMGLPFFPQVGPPPTFNPLPPPPTPTPPVTVVPRPPAPPPLRPRWTAAADLTNMTLRPEYAPAFTRDRKVVVQYGGRTGIIQAFDAADGTPLPGFSGHRGSPALGWLAVFGDRVASTGSDGKVAVWLARTGEKTTDLRFPEVPGLSSSFSSVRAVSPTGRYSALGRRPQKTQDVGVFKVLDTTTGKLLVEGPWHAASGSGQIVFTADELRVLVVNGGGTATWYKLPSGEKDAEWPAGQGTTVKTARVPSVSADGGRVVFYGTLPGGSGLGTAVVDGRTGEVVRKLDNPPYQPAVASLSPDGKRVAVPVSDSRDGILWHVDVVEVATGRKLGRITPPRESGAEVPRPRFSSDGRSVAVTFPAAKQVALYPADPFEDAPPKGVP